FSTKIKDHMCGFKAFKKDVILKLIEEMKYDAALARGVFWDTELIVRAIRNNFSISEIPIWWRERNKTALSFKREIKSLSYIISFFFVLRKEKKAKNRLFNSMR
ncbi:MAG: hypothetical protein ABII27_00180, partial [bacterium]